MPALKKILALGVVLVFFTGQLAGCAKEKTSASQIAPLDKNEIKVVYVNSGNAVIKEFTDGELLGSIMDALDKIKFSKMSPQQEGEVLDQGQKFNERSTFSVLLETGEGLRPAHIVLISEKELLLADSETMSDSRTVLYMNQNDESSLSAVKQIYSQVREAMAGVIPQGELAEGKITARYWLGDAGEKIIHYFVRAAADGQKDLLDTQGKVILSGFESYDLLLKLIFAKKEGKWGLYDQTGQVILAPAYEEILNPEMPDGYKVNGLVRVKFHGLWGAIDQDGKMIILPQFDFIHLTYYEEVEPFIKVEKNGKFGYVTREGKPLVDTIWDAAYMDVLNVPEDIIFVKKDGKWGGIRVKDGSAQAIDWDLQPSEAVQLSFQNWRYDYQWDFYTHQIQNGQTEITPVTKLFFHDYFSKNSTELRLLPEFSPGGALDWSALSDYLIFNTSEEWEDGYVTEAEFEKFMDRFFRDVQYSPKPGYGLVFKDGKYTYVGGTDAHGSFLYELTGLEKGRTKEGQDKWKATIKGYYFYELDSDPDAGHYSENAKVVWEEMKKEEYKGRSFWEVRDSLVLRDPGSKLQASTEWTIEFTVNDPKEDIYFTYLSCARKNLE